MNMTTVITPQNKTEVQAALCLKIDSLTIQRLDTILKLENCQSEEERRELLVEVYTMARDRTQLESLLMKTISY